MLADANAYHACADSKTQLIAVVQYRESVCDKFKTDNVTTENTGFKWPWQK